MDARGQGKSEEWASLSEEAEFACKALARRRGLDGDTAADLAHAAVAAYVERVQRGEPTRRPLAWILGLVRHEVADFFRGRKVTWGTGRRDGASCGDLTQKPDARAVEPATELEAREVSATAKGILQSLPPPYLHIARLQYLAGWTRDQVANWLSSWRPVGKNTCRRLILRTHAMLRRLGDDPRRPAHFLWPARFDPRRNPWICTPPPPS